MILTLALGILGWACLVAFVVGLCFIARDSDRDLERIAAQEGWRNGHS